MLDRRRLLCLVCLIAAQWAVNAASTSELDERVALEVKRRTLEEKNFKAKQALNAAIEKKLFEEAQLAEKSQAKASLLSTMSPSFKAAYSKVMSKVTEFHAQHPWATFVGVGPNVKKTEKSLAIGDVTKHFVWLGIDSVTHKKSSGKEAVIPAEFEGLPVISFMVQDQSGPVQSKSKEPRSPSGTVKTPTSPRSSTTVKTLTTPRSSDVEVKTRFQQAMQLLERDSAVSSAGMSSSSGSRLARRMSRRTQAALRTAASTVMTSQMKDFEATYNPVMPGVCFGPSPGANLGGDGTLGALLCTANHPTSRWGLSNQHVYGAWTNQGTITGHPQRVGAYGQRVANA